MGLQQQQPFSALLLLLLVLLASTASAHRRCFSGITTLSGTTGDSNNEANPCPGGSCAADWQLAFDNVTQVVNHFQVQLGPHHVALSSLHEGATVNTLACTSQFDSEASEYITTFAVHSGYTSGSATFEWRYAWEETLLDSGFSACGTLLAGGELDDSDVTFIGMNVDIVVLEVGSWTSADADVEPEYAMYAFEIDCDDMQEDPSPSSTPSSTPSNTATATSTPSNTASPSAAATASVSTSLSPSSSVPPTPSATPSATPSSAPQYQDDDDDYRACYRLPVALAPEGDDAYVPSFCDEDADCQAVLSLQLRYGMLVPRDLRLTVNDACVVYGDTSMPYSDCSVDPDNSSRSIFTVSDNGNRVLLRLTSANDNCTALELSTLRVHTVVEQSRYEAQELASLESYRVVCADVSDECATQPASVIDTDNQDDATCGSQCMTGQVRFTTCFGHGGQCPTLSTLYDYEVRFQACGDGRPAKLQSFTLARDGVSVVSTENDEYFVCTGAGGVFGVSFDDVDGVSVDMWWQLQSGATCANLAGSGLGELSLSPLQSVMVNTPGYTLYTGNSYVHNREQHASLAHARCLPESQIRCAHYCLSSEIALGMAAVPESSPCFGSEASCLFSYDMELDMCEDGRKTASSLSVRANGITLVDKVDMTIYCSIFSSGGSELVVYYSAASTGQEVAFVWSLPANVYCHSALWNHVAQADYRMIDFIVNGFHETLGIVADMASSSPTEDTTLAGAMATCSAPEEAPCVLECARTDTQYWRAHKGNFWRRLDEPRSMCGIDYLPLINTAAPPPSNVATQVLTLVRAVALLDLNLAENLYDARACHVNPRDLLPPAVRSVYDKARARYGEAGSCSSVVVGSAATTLEYWTTTLTSYLQDTLPDCAILARSQLANSNAWNTTLHYVLPVEPHHVCTSVTAHQQCTSVFGYYNPNLAPIYVGLGEHNRLVARSGEAVGVTPSSFFDSFEDTRANGTFAVTWSCGKYVRRELAWRLETPLVDNNGWAVRHAVAHWKDGERCTQTQLDAI
jgi:hypothetical protein